MNQPPVISPVHLSMGTSANEPEPSPELADLYRGFEKELLVPLWTEIGDLMPHTPKSKAQPHLWEWSKLLELAGLAGNLVPVGRGGERRAIALANPSLGGRPMRPPPSGPRSNTSCRARTRPSTATPRTPSVSSSRAPACGPSLSATRSR